MCDSSECNHTLHANMSRIKDRNGMDLTEAEDTKMMWQEYTEELYKKDIHDPDNHDGVIAHLEPDILECEVKWALGSITTNKASGGDGIPAELLKILKDDAVKVLTPSVQFSSVAQLCPTLCDPMDCSTPGFPVDHQLPELAQTHVHPFGNAVQPTQPLSSPSPPAFNLSQHQGLFHSESVLHIRWPKYWNFRFSISHSNEYSALIPFRIDWLDLLAIQGTLKSLLFLI